MEICPPVVKNLHVEGFKTEQLKVYPNPSNGSITVEIPEETSGTLVVCGILGNEILKKGINSGESTIHLDIQKSGIYFLMMKSNDQLYRCRLVVQ